MNSAVCRRGCCRHEPLCLRNSTVSPAECSTSPSTFLLRGGDGGDEMMLLEAVVVVGGGGDGVVGKVGCGGRRW